VRWRSVKELAARNIKWFSDSKAKNEIADYIEAHFHPDEDEYALGVLLSVFTLV
jgi:hypothetical protein